VYPQGLLGESEDWQTASPVWRAAVHLSSEHVILEDVDEESGLKDSNWILSPLDGGQPMHGLQVTHKMSLPVSIWTKNSLAGFPNFTRVK
jgi:hypothetical protein